MKTDLAIHMSAKPAASHSLPYASAPRLALMIMMAGLFLVAALPRAWGQNVLFLGTSGDTVYFETTHSQVINAVWQTCSGSVCTQSGSASGMGALQSSGTFTFTAPNATPFTLVANSNGSFAVSQSSPIGFSYNSPEGTLMGTVQFTSVSQTNSSDESDLVGTLTVTGGTFASEFAGGGTFNLEQALGFPLSDLVGPNPTMTQITSEIEYPSTLTSGPTCTAASSIGSNFNGTGIKGGDYIWFNANFNAKGMVNGTVVNYSGGTITFSANGQNYNLTVPAATITFSNAVTTDSTSFNTTTQTWQTVVPVGGDDEIFLSGLAFLVPAGGLPGGINPVTWSGNFSTNTAGVNVQWAWGAAAYTSFSSDYNSLGVKAGHQHDANYNNGDHAGTPENFKNSVTGGARGGGGGNATGSWSSTVSVVPCDGH